MEFIKELRDKASKIGARIAFNEVEDERILTAVVEIKKLGVSIPVLVGKTDVINQKAEEFGLDITGVEIIDMDSFDRRDELAEMFFELRKAKGITMEQANETMKNSMYFATMLLKADIVDGLVSGSRHSTGDVLRPSLQIIKTANKGDIVSTYFLMIKGEEQLLFSDCGLNITPNPEQLSKIAKSTYDSALSYGLSPKLAFLSFSTKGSAKHPEVDKVIEAGKLFAEENPNLIENYDYELQFDAAYVPSVQAQKAPESKIKGQTNVFIFPDLNSGNISYKIAQRLGGYLAMGPLIQGLAKPVNDLSRGCNVEEIINACAITAVSVKRNK